MTPEIRRQPRPVPARTALLTALVSLTLAFSPVAGQGFPPVSPAERSLVEVPGQPGAPAVMIYKKAELRFMDYPTDVSSTLSVDVRMKILTEEGKEYAEVEIPHSRFMRLRDLEARTLLPDGTSVPVPEEAIFKERRSRSARLFDTTVVFPAVEVGAILDYRYKLSWDDIVYPAPWYLHDEVPVLLSEIRYFKPHNLAIKPWIMRSGPREIHTEGKETPRGVELRVWAENLGGLPDEPFSPPFGDLSSRCMMLPAAIDLGGGRRPLLDSWQSVLELYVDDYRKARRKDRKVRDHAAELVAGAASPREKTAKLHAFVRDEIGTVSSLSIGIAESERAPAVLQNGEGTPVAKALLLQAMLDAVDVDSDLLWVADRREGRVDLTLANPFWFDSALVRVVLDDTPIYLDAADSRAGFGVIPPYYEGSQALLVVDKGEPDLVTLPATAHEENRQRATVDLVVQEDGGLTGAGSLELTGNQAFRYLSTGNEEKEPAESWLERLEEDFDRFEVSDVAVEEDVDARRLRVEWSLRLRESEVLGDEVMIRPSAPVGPLSQPFTLTPELRRTPVQLDFGRQDEVVTTVRWPEGWELDAVPRVASYQGAAGSFGLEIEEDAEARRITLRRRFERPQHRFDNPEKYGALRDLYDAAARSDAETLVLFSE